MKLLHARRRILRTNREVTWRRTVSGFLIAAFLFIATSSLWSPRSSACGPFFTDAIFVFTKHPDFPLHNFASGKLGVVSPTWARSYLVAAYRTLSGNPLNENEAKALGSLWEDRLNLKDVNDDTWTAKWIEARKKVPGAISITEVQTYRAREKPHEYEEFLNCQPDAFQSASAILNERIARFGAESRQVAGWLSSQDIVFANCHEGSHIPDGVSADQDHLIRSDRAYQIAAANFYATNFDAAKQQFDAIADKNSPYRLIAPYLAARAMLRKGSFADKEEDRNPPLADAENRLNAILKNDMLKASHPAAARLLNLVGLRLHPEARLHELAHSILQRSGTGDFKQTVWDYTVLMDKYLENDTGDETKKPNLPANFSSEELTDWIITFEGGVASPATHALELWGKTKSPAWLVAALTNAKAQTPGLNELLAAAAGVNSSSPAFPSLVFHRTRLLNETNRAAQARALLDNILTKERGRLNASALNLFLGQRLMLAQNLSDFLQNAQRAPAGFSDDYDGREIPEDPKEAEQTAKGSKYFFDLDAANVFNKAMPVGVMKEAAIVKTLAPNLRRDVAQATFMRAALLDDRESALQAAAVLREYYPQISEFLAAYEQAATPEARRFAAAFMSLKFPGLRPFVVAGIGRTTAVDDVDSYRDNYWCAEPPTQQNGSMSGEDPQEQNKARPVVPPDFLKSSQSVAQRQFASIRVLGNAPNYLCRIAIEWTEKNPNDPRSPEALHLAVRSTRYGCTDGDTGSWSKAAFDLLHSRYPNTTWARNTKYWFKG